MPAVRPGRASFLATGPDGIHNLRPGGLIVATVSSALVSGSRIDSATVHPHTLAVKALTSPERPQSNVSHADMNKSIFRKSLNPESRQPHEGENADCPACGKCQAGRFRTLDVPRNSRIGWLLK